MVLTKEDAMHKLEQGTHVLVVTNGRVENSIRYVPGMLAHLVALKDASENLTFSPPLPFSFTDHQDVESACLVEIEGKRLLFSVPSSAKPETLTQGCRVVCLTSQGRKEGVVASKIMRISQSMHHVLSTLTGATFPLKPIVAAVSVNYFPPYKG